MIILQQLSSVWHGLWMNSLTLITMAIGAGSVLTNFPPEKKNMYLTEVCIHFEIQMQRCHREHSKFPENLLRGSETTKTEEAKRPRGGVCGRGVSPLQRCGAFLFFNVELCVLVIFTYYYTLFLCLIEYWVLIVIL